MRRDIETRFKPKPSSFSRIPLSTYVDKQTDALVRSLPNRSEWLRRVITEAAQRELMGNDSEPVTGSAIAKQSTHKGGDE